jgi:hypothetical protein
MAGQTMATGRRRYKSPDDIVAAATCRHRICHNLITNIYKSFG